MRSYELNDSRFLRALTGTHMYTTSLGVRCPRASGFDVFNAVVVVVTKTSQASHKQKKNV